MEQSLRMLSVGQDVSRATQSFGDPKSLSFRLRQGGSAIEKASNAGDTGVRWTPEMIKMTNVGLELRRKGLIKF